MSSLQVYNIKSWTPITTVNKTRNILSLQNVHLLVSLYLEDIMIESSTHIYTPAFHSLMRSCCNRQGCNSTWVSRVGSSPSTWVRCHLPASQCVLAGRMGAWIARSWNGTHIWIQAFQNAPPFFFLPVNFICSWSSYLSLTFFLIIKKRVQVWGNN